MLSTTQFSTRFDVRCGYNVLSVAGALDVTTTPLFRDVVEHLLGTGRRHLILDLGDLEFMDSSGVSSLVHLLRRQRQLGIQDLWILGCSRFVRNLIKIGRFDQHVRCLDALPQR